MKTTLAILSSACAVALILLYSLRPDWAAAATLFPPWGWCLGWLLVLAALRKRSFVVATGCWILFVILHVEEPRSLWRGLQDAATPASFLRVTTLNCSGQSSALEHALQDRPDVLLIQESPTEEALQDLLKDYEDYRLAYGFDASILARGPMRERTSGHLFRSAEVTFGGSSLHVVSLRLPTSNPRIDLWNPGCWSAQQTLRKRQRDEMRTVLEALPPEGPLIVGGDFNVPPGDPVCALLQPRLRDSFRDGGRGWCNTLTREYPVLRIDQVWTSADLLCLDGQTRIVDATDHRAYSATFLRVEAAGP